MKNKIKGLAKKEIKDARAQIKKGEYYTEEEAKKILGINK